LEATALGKPAALPSQPVTWPPLYGTNSVRQLSLKLSQVVEVLGELGFGHGESLSAAG
jgi:hypothetical protein